MDNLPSIELIEKTKALQYILKGTKGPTNADIMVIGEAYGANEEIAGKPFVGASGQELDKMLIEAGIDTNKVFYTNCINERPMGNNFTKLLHPNVYARRDKLTPYRDVYPQLKLREALSILEEQIKIVQPKIIITLGNWPLWFLFDGIPHVKTDKGFKVAIGIDSRRGSMYKTREIGGKRYPLLPTYHPAGILRQWSWRHTSVHDFRRAKDYITGQLPWEDTRRFNWKIAPTANEVEDWVDQFLARPVNPRNLVLDLETYKQQIHIFGVRGPKGCLCIPFFRVTKQGTTPVYSLEDHRRIVHALRRLLRDPLVGLEGQNLVYDLQYIDRCLHVRPKIAFDTMIAQHILFVDDRKGLDYLASIYCRFYQYWKSERKESLNSESTQEGCEYNCKDLEYTYEVSRVLKNLLDKEGLTSLFKDRIELTHILLKMMRRGVRINPEAQASMGLELVKTQMSVIAWLERAMPNRLKEGFKPRTAPWYSSTKKLNTIFYERLKFRAVIDRKTGNFTVNKEAMTTLINRYPLLKPLFNMIAALRSLRVFYSTFVTAPVDNDGRMRCEYKPAGPITYRLASAQNVFGSGMNLQNIPRDREQITLYNAVEKLG